jgi:hypothetical protein
MIGRVSSASGVPHGERSSSTHVSKSLSHIAGKVNQFLKTQGKELMGAGAPPSISTKATRDAHQVAKTAKTRLQ